MGQGTSNTVATLIQKGHRALKEGNWTTARDAFRDAIEEREDANALYGLGEASWWLGDMEGTIAHFERAYAASRRRDDSAFAAAVAMRLGFHYHTHLANAAAAGGWLGRAERLIDEHDLDELRGDLMLMKAHCESDPAAGEQLARAALGRARRAGDVDLELCTLSQIGMSLVEQGHVEEGISMLDEAMAGSLGGEPADLDTVVFTSCNMMVSCARCAALKRAIDWVRAAERFVSRYGCPFLYAECRTIYGAVLAAEGRWPDAEDALEEAIELARDSVPAFHAEAAAALADLRISQGRLEEAERILEDITGRRAAVSVRARLHLLSGNATSAAAEIRRLLESVGESGPGSDVLHELLGEAEISLGNMESAVDRGRALAERGESLGWDIAQARGERLWGHAQAPSDPLSAGRHLDAALAHFLRLGMPFEAARTRLMLAENLKESELATSEARTALDVFENLGAAREADRAASLLRDLGVHASRSGPKGLEPLTKREREVLPLLGEGLSNPEIADRLFISRKTVEHHVSSILAKLDVNNRAEAAAESVRLQSRESAQK